MKKNGAQVKNLSDDPCADDEEVTTALIPPQIPV